MFCSDQELVFDLQVACSAVDDGHEVLAFIDVGMTMAILQLEVGDTRAQLDAVLAVAEVHDPIVASTFSQYEGVSATAAPELVISLSAYELVVAAATFEAVIASSSNEVVMARGAIEAVVAVLTLESVC